MHATKQQHYVHQHSFEKFCDFQEPEMLHNTDVCIQWEKKNLLSIMSTELIRNLFDL
jgi:hypothetical protein